LTDQTIRDRVRGTLIGLAAGDRIGGPVRMAVRLAESLADRRRFDPGDVLVRYLGWWREGAFDTGPTAAEVLALIDAGVPQQVAVERVHRDSGGPCSPPEQSPKGRQVLPKTEALPPSDPQGSMGVSTGPRDRSHGRVRSLDQGPGPDGGQSP